MTANRHIVGNGVAELGLTIHNGRAGVESAAGFEGHDIEEVELEELFEWLQDLDEDNAMIAVCPNTHFEGAIVEPAQLMADLIGK